MWLMVSQVLASLTRLTPEALITIMEGMGYPVYQGDYNLNLVGVRAADHDSNRFNDALLILYMVAGRWHLHFFSFTTDPGEHYRENPINTLSWMLAYRHSPG